MEKILVYRLTKRGVNVCLQVLEQASRSHTCEVREVNLQVECHSYPELRDRKVFLRGHNTKMDVAIAKATFFTHVGRDKYFDQLHTALFEWATGLGANVRIDGGDGVVLLLRE